MRTICRTIAYIKKVCVQCIIYFERFFCGISNIAVFQKPKQATMMQQFSEMEVTYNCLILVLWQGSWSHRALQE